MVAPRMQPPPPVVGTETACPNAQGGFSSASTCPGSCAGCVTVRPTMAGRPQAISGRYQSIALRPNTGDQGVEGHAPVAQREGLFHCLSPTDHGGHEQRWPDQEHPCGGLEL